MQCDLLAGLDDGGHHRHAVAGHRDTVKADHRNILRYPQPGAYQRPDGAKGDDIAHGEEGGELCPSGQQTVHGVVGGFEIVVGQAVQLVVEHNARILHGLLCALTAHQTGVAGHRTAQNGDLAVPLPDQVVHSGIGRCPVIYAHHGKVGEVQLVRDQRGEHRGNIDTVEAPLEVGYAAAQEDDAFGLDLPQDLFGGVDLVGVLVQVRDDAVVPVQGGGALELHQKIRKEDVPGALYHKHKAAGLLDLQLSGVGVGHKPGLPHHLQNVLLGLRADIRPVVDHTGDGADRATADPCDVLDGQVCHVGGPRFLKVFRERCRERFQRHKYGTFCTKNQ